MAQTLSLPTIVGRSLGNSTSSSASVWFFKNGLRMQAGSSFDFVVDGRQVLFTQNAYWAGDVAVATYEIADGLDHDHANDWALSANAVYSPSVALVAAGGVVAPHIPSNQTIFGPSVAFRVTLAHVAAVSSLYAPTAACTYHAVLPNVPPRPNPHVPTAAYVVVSGTISSSAAIYASAARPVLGLPSIAPADRGTAFPSAIHAVAYVTTSHKAASSSANFPVIGIVPWPLALPVVVSSEVLRGPAASPGPVFAVSPATVAAAVVRPPETLSTYRVICALIPASSQIDVSACLVVGPYSSLPLIGSSADVFPPTTHAVAYVTSSHFESGGAPLAPTTVNINYVFPPHAYPGVSAYTPEVLNDDMVVSCCFVGI